MYLSPNYVKFFPDVIWNIPVLCGDKESLIKLSDKIQYIAYGSPRCYFNCGRTGSDIGLNYLFSNISLLNKKNIPCYVTFSNYNIEEKYLISDFLNQVLEMLNSNNNNGVICSSEILRKYIKCNYPNLKLKASMILSTILGKENDSVWYTEQLDLYDYVVIHVDATLDTLKKLPDNHLDKFEILVNETCMKNCPNRKEHCYNTDRKTYEVLRYEHCISDKLDESQTCRMSLNEVQKLVDIGFTSFKLQGRPYNNQLIKELLALEI